MYVEVQDSSPHCPVYFNSMFVPLCAWSADHSKSRRVVQPFIPRYFVLSFVRSDRTGHLGKFLRLLRNTEGPEQFSFDDRVMNGRSSFFSLHWIFWISLPLGPLSPPNERLLGALGSSCRCCCCCCCFRCCRKRYVVMESGQHCARTEFDCSALYTTFAWHSYVNNEVEYTIIADIRASAVKDQTVQVTTSSKTMRSVCSEKRDYAYTAGSWSPSCAFWEPIPIFRPCLSTCSTLALATIRGINLQGSAPLQGGGRFSSSDEVAGI